MDAQVMEWFESMRNRALEGATNGLSADLSVEQDAMHSHEHDRSNHNRANRGNSPRTPIEALRA